jgi:hypothetical protein
VLRLAVLGRSEIRMSLDVVVIVLADVRAVLRGAVLRGAVLRAVGLDVVALVVLTPDLRGAVLRCVMLMELDVLLLLVEPILWPLFHLNCLLFEFPNLHPRRSWYPKSSRRRFKNAIPADILPA